jgi:hypothetical protein
MRVTIAYLIAFLCVLLWTGHALADDTAEDLKRQGDTLAAQKSFVEALAAYDKSYALSPNPALHFNRGRALQFLARYPEALDAFERFQTEATPELKARAPGLDELVAQLRTKVATLDVMCAVQGARVLIGGREVGVTPIATPVRINAGRVKVEAFADGYFPFQREIDAAGGRRIDVDLTLQSRVTSGVLVVRSHVPQTNVLIDAKPVGLTPVEAVLGAGSHPVVVTRDGYDENKTQVVIRAGEQRVLSLDPIKRRPITSRWWFWTGAGVIVTGIVVGVLVVAFTTERGLDSGTIPPFKILTP